MHRDWKHESSRASGTGRAFAAATVGHGQTKRLLKAAWSEGSDARALLANSYPDLEDGSRCAQPRATTFCCREMSVLRRRLTERYRVEKWSWTDCSHSHCLFGEESLDVLERREDWEAWCADYVRRAVHDVGAYVQHRVRVVRGLRGACHC